jgi:hypothetical protein
MSHRLRRAGAPLAVAVGAAAGLTAESALADTVEGTRSNLLQEQAHSVAITVDRGHAKLVVRRTVYNGGARHDQAVFWIEVPPSSVAVGLRTLGTLRGRPHWFDGELMEAEAAAARYQELTGVGGYYPKDPALLSWQSQTNLALQVFPCAPHAKKTVEYTLIMPTEYSEGQHRLTLFALGTERLPARLTARPAQQGDTILVDGKPLANGHAVRVPRDGDVTLALVPHSPALLSGALAVKQFATGRVLTRYHVEAAPRLSTVPKGAWIVVVLDGSRSLGPEEAAGEVGAARAYLSHFPDAQVEVLTFDRDVHRRFGRFVTVKQGRADLEGYTIARRNGSNVDAALHQADQLLAGAPRQAPRRIVLLTDARMRSSLTPQRLRATLGRSRALLQIGVLESAAAWLKRDDSHAWAMVARPTGGLVWHTGATNSPDEASQMEAVFEEWARPLRIDRLRVEADGIDPDESGFPTVLNEGEGLVDLRINPQPARSVRVEGELWASPVRTVLVPDTKETKRWSALVFGSELLNELSEPEMMTLAQYGGAVSPVTSYLAIEPGVRPSTEGLKLSESVARGGIGHGSGTGSGMGFGRARPSFDPLEYLKQALAPGWAACGGQPDSADVELETTLAEVVDVLTVILDSSSDLVLERCLAQAVWDLDLPDAFDMPWHAWSISV